MSKIQNLIRWILTAALLYGVYTETGIWTAISIFLIFAGFEMITLIMRKATSGFNDTFKTIINEAKKKPAPVDIKPTIETDDVKKGRVPIFYPFRGGNA